MSRTPDDFMKAYESATNRHDLEATLALIDEDAIYLFSDESVHAGKPASRSGRGTTILARSGEGLCHF